MSKLEFENADEVWLFITRIEDWATAGQVSWALKARGSVGTIYTTGSEEIGAFIDFLGVLERENANRHELPLDLAARLPYAIKRLKQLFSTGA